jgi:quinol monooxygenase YgiN
MNQSKVALWVVLEAKGGKEKELETFLKGALPLAQQEEFTLGWYIIRMGPSKFGIFDTFADDSGREKHLKGQIASALMAKAPELLAKEPRIEKVDILAAK